MGGFFQIDINCDMGEWSSQSLYQGDMLSQALKESDKAIMSYISSANIACGAHGGDTNSMEQTIRLAMQHGVAIGAHPGYPDPEGFGRRHMVISHNDLHTSLTSQIHAIKRLVESMGGKLAHVKPHGALYNEAAADEQLASTIVRCVKEIDPSLVLFGSPGSALEKMSRETGLPFASEAFADRAYNSDGSLRDRKLPGAILNQVNGMIRRILTLITKGYVITHEGKKLEMKADTICIHGDNPVAPAFVQQLLGSLARAGIVVRPPGRS